MNYFLKEKLEDRLEYCIGWRKETEIYLLYKNLNDTVNYEYYKKRPLSKFLLMILNLPVNILSFIHSLKIRRDLEKNLIEIEYIHNQLNEK